MISPRVPTPRKRSCGFRIPCYQDPERNYWPASGEALDGASCAPAAGEADSPPASGGTDSCPASGGTDSWPPAPAAGSGDAEDAPPPGFPTPGFAPPGLPKTGWSPPKGFRFWRTRSTRLGLSTPPVFMPPPATDEPAPVSPYPKGWTPGTAPYGHFDQRPQERLLPITFSAPHTTPMQITNATAAATRPFTRIERRLGVGRRLNQSRAARILPTKLSLKSGRPDMVPSKLPAFCCPRRARSFVGILRTRPEAASRYALRIADPPVIIMAVRAAPSSVPATPKREVTKDAAVAASPADMTWCGLIIGSALLALTGHESISLSTSFQRLHQTFS